MTNQSNASASPILPAVVTLTVTNKPPSCGIEIGRTVSSMSGNPTCLRIVSFNVCYSQTEDDPHLGDEIVSINNVDPKNSVDAAMKLLADAKGNTVEMQVLRTNAQVYREALVSSRFYEYSVQFESSNKAILKPKDNPSMLKATLAPMYFTRFKYSITFDDRTGAVSFEDLYAITFNRSNGATPQQQQRIQDRHHAFRSQLEKMEATMEHNREEARKLALS
eukprot:CAMPEP_0197719364 /NCGR_PEP_ID=MMETSP1434-20131217/3153_1 /TAXON_ID=265543 /ORGANISM="Minutocellus polymorphus, Strain CCMP3303" /LENGTH=220 /DNA_ID=CAMNT_0043304109 /DNA_START=175 /DNA_END=837 /DNA_ORIENTATION=-